MNNEVMIVVDILCETQHYNTVLNAIYKCASESVLEDGCERYDVYPDTNGSQKITLVEMWRDIDSLEHFSIYATRSLCCIIACWTEALPARCVRVGVVYAMGICFLEALAKSANLISLPIII